MTGPIGILKKLKLKPKTTAHKIGNKAIFRIAVLTVPPNFSIIVFFEKFIPFWYAILKYFSLMLTNTYHLVSGLFYILSICIH